MDKEAFSNSIELLKLNIFCGPVNVAEGRSIDGLHWETALEHSTFHLLDPATSFFIVSALMLMKMDIGYGTFHGI